MYIGLIGAFLFIIIQLILLVDFAHNWNSAWVDNMEESDNRGWFAALLTFTGGMYIGTIAGVVCLFVFFTQSSVSSCQTEKFVVSFQLILCVIVSVISISPPVQEQQPRSGMYSQPLMIIIKNLF